MTNRLYVAEWAPLRYLAAAMLQAKPIADLELLPIGRLDHPVVTGTKQYWTPPFMAFADELATPVFTAFAVAEALDRKFPEASLCGENAARRGLVRSLTHVIDEGFMLLACGHMDTFEQYNGPMWHAGSQAAKVFEEGYVKKLEVVERCCGDSGLLLGEHAYLPDALLAACSWFAEDCGLPPVPAQCPKLARWVDRNARGTPFSRPSA